MPPNPPFLPLTFAMVDAIAGHLGGDAGRPVDTSNLICLTLADLALNLIFTVFAVIDPFSRSVRRGGGGERKK